MGAPPTTRVKRSAKAERDAPATAASFDTLQP